jgi:hypothetical protein
MKHKKTVFALAFVVGSPLALQAQSTVPESVRLFGRATGDMLSRVMRSVATPLASGPTAACANPSGGYQGFGRSTTGGAGRAVYRVTNLNDSGGGSLREALSQGNRCVVFDVGGTITLNGNLLVRGANVTIDGLTAPAPGITLTKATLSVQGGSGASNVVVRGIRVRNTPGDAISLYNTSNVVVDRVSASGFGDGAIDITEQTRNVTVQWSIIGQGVDPTSNNLNLIKYETTRVSVHHNLYVNGNDRNPNCERSDGATSLPSEVVCDVRNNLIWNYQWSGTSIRAFGAGNVINNYYYTHQSSDNGRAVWTADGGSVYAFGNHSANGWNVNKGNRSTPYAADAPTTTDAVTAAKQVVAQAGARGPRFGLDSTDTSFLGQISVN